MRMRLKRYVDAIGVHETSIMQYMEDYGMKYRILDEILLETGLGWQNMCSVHKRNTKKSALTS